MKMNKCFRVVYIGAGFLLLIAFKGVSYAEGKKNITCPSDKADVLKETAVKLKLLEQGYRIIKTDFDKSTNCFHIVGYNYGKHKVRIVVNPYTAEIVDQEEIEQKADRKALSDSAP